jgi:hypothetical protein
MKYPHLVPLMLAMVFTTAPMALPAAPTTAPYIDQSALVAAIGNAAINLTNAQMNCQTATVTVAVAAALKASLPNPGEAATAADSAWHDAVKAQDQATANLTLALTNLRIVNEMLKNSIAKNQDNASALPATPQK